MLSAAIRVLARSAAIQLEEVAALSAVSRPAPVPYATASSSTSAVSASSVKGKERAYDHVAADIQDQSHVQHGRPDEAEYVGELFPQGSSLSATLERHEARKNASTGKSSLPSATSSRSLSPLDRLIQQSPHILPAAAPDTHPDRKYEAERAAREREKAKASQQSTTRPPKLVKPPVATAKGTGNTYSKQPLDLDQLIRSSPRSPPPPAPSSHPDRHLEKKLNGAAKSAQTATLAAPPSVASSSTNTESPLATESGSPTPGTIHSPSPEPVGPVSEPSSTSSSEKTPVTATNPISATATVQPIDQVDTTQVLSVDPTTISAQIAEEDSDVPVVLRASKVPSSRIGRLFHYGSLAASLSFGAASESIRRTTGGTNAGSGSVFMSDANIRRLVSTLGRMRGAALKLGQFMSIQDNHMLPPEIERVLHQVQAHANYMPDWQMEKVMREEFGSDWQSLFSTFERTPIASASIGQVHRATLASDGTSVAVKIQFPGVASSIESDLSNLSLLLRSSALLPKGLYLQNTIAVMRRELQDECDYVKEAAAGRRFTEYLEKDEYFTVPKVVEEATTGKVLTTQWLDGKPLSKVKGLSQETRDRIGKNILRLCLMELFQFRFMQTDPNWANFLYSSSPESIQLIDFGASREYTKEFMDGWYRLLNSCLIGDREKMKEESLNLGYLTGEENDVMLEAHLDSMALVASPFSHPGPYPFAKQTITDSIRGLIPIMLKHRLTPPPQETYSLNRKLSGAFLMCAKLGANVDCQKLWEEVVGNYKEG